MTKNINFIGAAQIASLTLAIAILGGFVVGGMLTITRTFTNTGTVKAVNVGVYWDSNCANPVTSIEWGSIEPGSQINKIVYIKNGGNTPLTLSLATQNWTPESASNYLQMTWNYDGQPVASDGIVEVTMTLQVSPDIEGITSFSFEALIVGTG